jgi:hypothetical protein
MDGCLVTLGDTASFQMELRWEEAEPTGTAAEATRGTLAVRLAGRTVWGATPDEPHGFSWTWVELVEHLARHWAYIFVEEGDPLGLDAPPELLRGAAEGRWAELTEERRAEEESLLWAYLESHDLANALQGAYPASLWVTREGNELRVACKGAVVRPALSDAREYLVALGDAIVSRLRVLGDEPRAMAALAAWEQREDVAPMRLAEIATGLDPAEISTLATSIRPFAE